MKNTKQTIEESIDKIKFMMNYDSSKTLTEQLEYGGQRIFGPSNREQLQKYFDDLKEMFDYIETYRSQLSKVPRGLDDAKISELSKTLYSTMQGLRLNKKPVADVFESLISASDFIALNDSFNATYGAKQDLYTWIINEVSMGRNVQQRILTKLRDLITAAASDKTSYEDDPTIEIQKPDPIVGPVDDLKPPEDVGTPITGGGGQFPFVNGTIKDPYINGTKGSGIGQVQQNMGLKVDGIWGPKTDAKIKELVPEYANGFTNQDLSTIIGKIHSAANAGINANTAKLKTVQPAIGVNSNPPVAQAKSQFFKPDPNANKLIPPQNKV
jgi:hypothetical protein